MFCPKCGSENAPDSVYCKKCGSVVEPEEETRVAKRKEDLPVRDSAVPLFSINPTLRFVWAGYILTAAAAFLIVAFLSILLPAVSPIIFVVIGLLLLLIPVYFHARQKLSRYTLTTDKLEIDHGLISRTTTSLPLTRVQDVTVKSTITQRLLGLGDIIVDNAGTDGDRLVFANIDRPRKYADILLDQVQKKAGDRF
ncbi:MAG: PH domain-containing protein [Acidobacteria bacterium]|nr:PH domain-containing protein [Acidobacteriota bacterium]